MFLTICLIAVLTVIGILCFLTPVFSRAMSNRIRIFYAIVILVLFSTPFACILTFDANYARQAMQTLPRVTPLALSAMFTSNLEENNKVLLISERIKDLVELRDVTYPGNLFPSINAFYLEQQAHYSQKDSCKYDFILLDCGQMPYLSHIFHYLTLDGFSRLKARLNETNSALIVLLPQQQLLSDAISASITPCFDRIRTIKIEETTFLFASDSQGTPTTDLDRINDFAVKQYLYGDNTIPHYSYSVILDSLWEISEAPSRNSVPATTPFNPTLLRIVAAMLFPQHLDTLSFLERYGLYCIFTLLACCIVFRYFVSGTPGIKSIFRDFELVFIFTCAVFNIQFNLAFSAAPSFISIWPLAGVLIFLFHFQLRPSNKDISTYSIKKQIIYTLMFFFGLFLGSRHSGDCNYSYIAIIAIIPLLRVFRDSCLAAQKDVSAWRVILRCTAGVVCGLLFSLCCILCNAGPFTLSVILTALIFLRMHALAQHQPSLAAE